MLTNRSDSAALRIRMRSEHEDDLTQVADRIAFAGPRLGDDAQTKLGNLTAISLYATCSVSPNPLLRSRAASASKGGTWVAPGLDDGRMPAARASCCSTKGHGLK